MPHLDHVTIAAADFPASLAFYDAVFTALGWVRAVELVDEEEEDAEIEVVGWGAPEGPAGFWLVEGLLPTTGLHLAVDAPDAAAVERFHAAAVAAGGRSHDAPRRWPIIRRGQFNAIVADPAGNLIEAVAPE